MPSLKEVRNKIVSVGSTMQITSAMKMVSAAKLKRAQDAITQMRPYAGKLREMLENVSASVDASENIYARTTPKLKKVLIVALSSNRGLAGAFNSNVIRKTNSLIKGEYAECDVTVLSVGRKVNEAFRRTKYGILGSDLPHHTNELYDKLTFDNVAPVAQKLMDAFTSGEFDRVVVVYNQFKNAAMQTTVEEQLLPIVPAASEGSSRTDYIFEPSQQYIVDELIPRTIKIQFYKALLDSFASEHGARMTAMHKATDKAKALQSDLRITYNKARQAAITKEILEIVAGAEALNG